MELCRVPPQHPAQAPRVPAGLPGCHGSPVLQLCFNVSNRGFCSVVDPSWLWRGGFHMSDDQWWAWTWWNMNDTPGSLFFLCTLVSLSPQIPKALIKLGLHQRPFPGDLLLMSVIIASTDVQSLSNQVNAELWKQLRLSMDNSVVLWELLTVPWTAVAYKRHYRPLLLFKEQETKKEPMIIMGPW